VALVSTAITVWWLWWNRAALRGPGLVAMVALDDFRWVADWVFLGAAALTVLISFAYLEREQLLIPEYYVLLIFATLGMMVMAAGADLMVIFLGLELMSVAVYVLAGLDRRRARSAEAALKYFLLGAFASGFLLYGIALAYGATGTTNLGLIGGNLFALGQRSLKRMLAYSSVAHAGYLLVAVTTGGAAGTSAFLVYVIAYTLMSLGAFAVLSAKGRAGESDVLIDDLAGLASQRPWPAFALAVCMLSLLGFPGTAGFIGKWYILIAATSAGQNTLAAILVLTSVVSAGYYLPVIMAMYMKPAPEPSVTAHIEVCLDRWGRTAVAAVVLGLLLFGVWPNRLLELARSAGDSVQPAV